MEEQTLTALSALSEKTRLRVLRYLVEVGLGGASAGDIGTHVGASPSRTSFHLSVLTEAGLIKATRVSRNMIYHVDFDAMGRLIGYLVRDCCKNDPRVKNCC